jgi:PAS domain S-box-containing protein
MTVPTWTALSAPDRLAALRRTALLESGPEEAFDRFTRLVARALRVPVALVSLVEVDRQALKSALGLPEPWATRREIPLSHSFCRYVVAAGAPLVVEDARSHPLVRENPAVTDLGMLAYAGVPLTTRDGHTLGTLAAVDLAPRAWSEDDLAILTDLAAAVVREIEARVTAREVERAHGFTERIMRASPEIVYIFDLGERRVVYDNARGPHVLGSRRDHPDRERDVLASVHPDDQPAVLRTLDQVRDLPDGETVEVEFRMPHADGGWRWLRARTVVFDRDSDGRPRQVLGVAEDVTDRRQAEAALRESEAKFAIAFADSPVAISISTLAEGRYVEVNDAVLDATGYTRAEVIGRTATDLNIFAYPEGREVLVRALRAGPVRNLELAIRRKDGAIRTVLLSARLTTLNDIPHILTTSLDVTEWKQTEAALRESERRLRALADNLPAGAVFQLIQPPDGSRRFSYISAGIEQLTGVTPEEAMRDAALLFDAIPEEDRPRYAEAVERARATNGVFEVELRQRHRGGELRWMQLRSITYQLDDGTLVSDGLQIDITERTAAETALREREERLRLAAEAARFGTYDDHGPDGVYWSRELKALFGLPADFDVSAGAATALERVHPEDRDRLAAALDAARDPHGDGRIEVEHRILRPDGATIWVLTKGRTIFERGGDGAPTRRAVGVVLDITERKRTEAALRERERLLTRIQETMADGLVIIDAHGRLVNANPAASRILGMSHEALPGTPTTSLVKRYTLDGEPRGDIPSIAELEASGDAFHHDEYLIERPDGTRVAIARTITALRDEQGRFLGGVSTFRDVTARIAAERELRENEQRLQLAGRIACLSVWEWDVASGSITCDDQYRELYGIPAGELPTVEVWLSRLHPDDRERLITGGQAVQRGGTDWNGEFRILHPEHGLRWVQGISRASARDAAGRVTRVIGINLDITERKQAEVEREALLTAESEARARAEAATRSKNDLVGTITHDLKGPLTTIKGTAQVLRRQAVRLGGVPEEFVRGLTSIDATTAKMAALLEELMDVVRLEAGEALTLNRQPVDLVTLVRGLVDAYQQTTARHILSVAAGTPELTGTWDGPRLERVLDNLLSNAIKYSPAGGTVTTRIDRTDAGGRCWARLEMCDEGIGIPAADLPRIFERYHRASNAAGRIAGAGIGLAGVRQLVEQHGGTITIDSAEGAGTTVTVLLPIDEC